MITLLTLLLIFYLIKKINDAYYQYIFMIHFQYRFKILSNKFGKIKKMKKKKLFYFIPILYTFNNIIRNKNKILFCKEEEENYKLRIGIIGSGIAGNLIYSKKGSTQAYFLNKIFKNNVDITIFEKEEK
jgi:hypothetical protein